MRPLNSKEASVNEGGDKHPTQGDKIPATANRVWRVLPTYSSVTQTTPSGQPLKEKVKGRSFFQFDKAFGEGSTTTEVYDACGLPLVNSILSGVNSTMFAYGQTSSGKTFTMSGDGAGKEKEGGKEGILQMSVRDLFRKIGESAEGREWLVRVSYIEIYNEEIRDLLVRAKDNTAESKQAFGNKGDKAEGTGGGGGAIVNVREDPKKGIYVEAEER